MFFCNGHGCFFIIRLTHLLCQYDCLEISIEYFSSATEDSHLIAEIRLKLVKLNSVVVG